MTGSEMPYSEMKCSDEEEMKCPEMVVRMGRSEMK